MNCLLNVMQRKKAFSVFSLMVKKIRCWPVNEILDLYDMFYITLLGRVYLWLKFTLSACNEICTAKIKYTRKLFQDKILKGIMASGHCWVLWSHCPQTLSLNVNCHTIMEHRTIAQFSALCLYLFLFSPVGRDSPWPSELYPSSSSRVR